MGKIQKEGKWVRHELSESAIANRLNICISLIARQKKKRYRVRLPVRNVRNVACEKKRSVLSQWNPFGAPFTPLRGTAIGGREVFRDKHLWNSRTYTQKSQRQPRRRCRRRSSLIVIDVDSCEIRGRIRARSWVAAATAGTEQEIRRDREPYLHRRWTTRHPPSQALLRQALFFVNSPIFVGTKMQPKMTVLCTLLAFIVVVAVSSLTADAMPHSHESYWDQQDDIDRDEFLEILSRLSRTVMNRPEMENSKRGLDLGLSRGFSGSQAAKHLMGLAAANYAGGPGRRRRSEQA
ncbi:Diuretic hormone class [Ooceraea biroi]|uniref:Diuretic hormone class n=2 Tax=Ooceraea biroi TaxID=2015173 RepID=A0A026WTL6_OOCBI|nr:Diuretic hormone class [Ooceraea biroi]